MAKQCIYCRQPLAKDDARFCNDCGRTQIPPAAPAAEPSPIKVKLPPKEFSRDDQYAPPQSPIIPERTAGTARLFQREQATQPPVIAEPNMGTARPFQREQAAQSSSRFPKRPVRLTADDLSAQGEAQEKKAQPEMPRTPDADAVPPKASSAIAEESTMVLPGWQAELDLLRKERTSAQSEKKAPFSTPEPETAPWRPQSTPAHLQQLSGTQKQEQTNSSIERESHLAEERARALEQPRRELHVKVWDQEPTAQLPQPPTKKNVPGTGAAPTITSKSVPGAGPAPAVTQTPFSALSFGPEEQAETLAGVDTALWQNRGNQTTTKTTGQPVEDEYATQLSVGETSQKEVEDLPTMALAVPEFVKGQPQLKIERTSTPRNEAAAKDEGVEDQPTRPMQMNSIAPRPPLPPAAEQPQTWPADRAAPTQRAVNPPSLPGAYGQAGFDALAPAGRTNPNSQPGNAFNSSPMPPLPHNPVSQPGNPARQSNVQSEWQAQNQRSPTQQPPSTSRPNSGSFSASLEKPRNKKSNGRLLVILLFLLIIGGIGAFIVYYQPFTNQLSQSDQAYQSTSLGVSLHYPLGWTVSNDHASGGVHFADSSATGQINLSNAAVNGSTLDQYVSQQVKQLGITNQKAAPTISFGGATWQQVQGSVAQNGATYSITLYVTQHNDHFYALACLTLPNVYTTMEHDDFAPMRASFQFL